MPRYDYQCPDCGAVDLRIAAIDDHTAICHKCGGLMLRLDDPFISSAPLRLGENLSQEVPDVSENHDEDPELA